ACPPTQPCPDVCCVLELGRLLADSRRGNAGGRAVGPLLALDAHRRATLSRQARGKRPNGPVEANNQGPDAPTGRLAGISRAESRRDAARCSNLHGLGVVAAEATLEATDWAGLVVGRHHRRSAVHARTTWQKGSRGLSGSREWPNPLVAPG